MEEIEKLSAQTGVSVELINHIYTCCPRLKPEINISLQRFARHHPCPDMDHALHDFKLKCKGLHVSEIAARCQESFGRSWLPIGVWVI